MGSKDEVIQASERTVLKAVVTANTAKPLVNEARALLKRLAAAGVVIPASHQLSDVIGDIVEIKPDRVTAVGAREFGVRLEATDALRNVVEALRALGKHHNVGDQRIHGGGSHV